MPCVSTPSRSTSDPWRIRTPLTNPSCVLPVYGVWREGPEGGDSDVPGLLRGWRHRCVVGTGASGPKRCRVPSWFGPVQSWFVPREFETAQGRCSRDVVGERVVVVTRPWTGTRTPRMNTTVVGDTGLRRPSPSSFDAWRLADGTNGPTGLCRLRPSFPSGRPCLAVSSLVAGGTGAG